MAGPQIVFPRLDAYGDGGFRFDRARVEGSVLIINGVVAPWPVAALAEATAARFDPVLAADPKPQFVLFGMGPRMGAPAPAVSARLRDAAIGLEFMDTGAACRAYAMLVGEGRRLAAALIAVD